MSGILVRHFLICPTTDTDLTIIDEDPTDEEGSTALRLLEHTKVKTQVVLLRPFQEERLIVGRLLT